MDNYAHGIDLLYCLTKFFIINFQKMISHEDDFDKANLVLTVDTQRGLQSLFDYVIYLGIKVFSLLFSFLFLI